MKLLNPEYLLIILFLPIFYFLGKKFGKSALMLFSNTAKTRTQADLKVKIPLFLDLIAVFFTILAFARPISLDKVITPPVEGKDIMFALDVSTSMRALDFQPKNRLQAAKNVIKQFVKTRKNDRLGLVFFANDSFLQVPLTTDYSVFENLLDKIKLGVIKDGTAIGNGLALAISRLVDSKTKSKIIILLTDGDNNSGNISPQTAMQIAKEKGIKVYTILIGTNEPVPYPVGKDFFGRMQYRKIKMKVNPDLLRTIAKTTGGKFYQSASPQELKKAFKDIEKLEKSKIPSKQYKIYNEFAPYFILFAILFLLLARISALVFPVFPEVER